MRIAESFDRHLNTAYLPISTQIIPIPEGKVSLRLKLLCRGPATVFFLPTPSSFKKSSICSRAKYNLEMNEDETFLTI